MLFVNKSSVKISREEKFAIVFDKYYKYVYKISYNILKDHKLMDDMVQEIFLRIWKAIDSINLDEEDATKGFVARVAVNTTINKYNKDKRISPNISEIDHDTLFAIASDRAANPSDIVADDASVQYIYEKISELGYSGTMQGNPKQIEGLSDIDKIYVSYSGKTCYALKKDGTVWSWGNNSNGQLGRGLSSSYEKKPGQIFGLDDVVDIQASQYSVYVLKADKTVVAWGRNDEGQLGNGTTVDSNVPVAVSGLKSIDMISAGDNHGIALASDGTVWTWGSNSYGQIGTGDTTSTSQLIPVQISSLNNIKYIYSKNKTCFAIQSNGQMWGWGNNNYWQLGNGTRENKFEPIEIIFPDKVIPEHVTGNGRDVFVLTNTGDVYAWGSNSYGIIGNGQYGYQNTPIKVSGLSSVKSIYAEDIYAAYAIMSDGSVYSWGIYPLGTTCYGYGNDSISRSPEKVEGLGNVISMDVYGNVKMALNDDGVIFAWGDNGYSQIGDDFTIYELYFPIPISNKNNKENSNTAYRYSMTLTDEDGYKSIYYYDSNNQLVATELSNDNTALHMTKYEYDYSGNKTMETDANNNSTKYIYDDLGRLSEKVDALGNVTTFKYNALDMLVEKIEPDNKITQYTYDAAGRLIFERTGLLNNINEEYFYKQYEMYDLSGNVLSFKQGHTSSGNEGKIVDSYITYVYNNRNLLKEKYEWIEGSDFCHSYYRYNNSGDKILERIYCDEDELDNYIDTQFSYDDLRRNIRVTTMAYYDGKNVGIIETGYRYDNNNNVIEKIDYTSDSSGNITEYDYDYANRVIEVREPVGTENDKRISKYTYDGRGNLTSETLVMDENDLTTSYSYDGMSNLISETNALGQVTRYGYDAVGNKIIETDPRFESSDLTYSNGMRYTYDDLNRLIKSEVYIDGNISVIEQKTYDGRNNVTGITLGDSTISSKMVYDANDNMIQYTPAYVVEKGASNIGKVMSYDSLGQVLKVKQYVDSSTYYTTSYQYYGTGLLKSAMYPDSEIPELYSYDFTGQLYEQKTDRNGGITKIFKSLFGTPYRTEYPDGTTEEYRLNWYLGLALAYYDRAGRRREYKYNKNKKVIEEQCFYGFGESQRLWKTVKYSYDEWDNLVTLETFDTIKDSNDEVILSETSLGDKVTYIYDDAFRNICVYDENGREQCYEYDAAGNLITHRIKANDNYDVKRYEYDAIGRVTAEITLVPNEQLSDADDYESDSEYTDMKKLITEYTYSGTMVATKTSPRGYITTYNYDSSYNIVSIESPHENVITYGYDYAGQVINENVSDGEIISYAYDSMGRNTTKSTISPNGETMIWHKQYDVMGNVVKESTPALYALGQHYTYTYDIMGHRLSTIDADGNTLQVCTYDEDGNITKVVDARNGAGIDDISKLSGDVYTYDVFGNMVSKTDALGNKTIYEYDLRGNIIKETNAIGYSTLYTYNNDNTLAQVIYPDGGQIKYTYDKKGRVLSETVKQSNGVDITQSYSYTPFDKVSTITDPYNNTVVNKYDGDGNVTQITDKRGNTSYSTYDGNNRIIEKKVPMTGEVYQIQQYTYNRAGLVETETIIGETSRTITYGYVNGFLTSVSNNGGQQTLYEYDGYGNRIGVKILRSDGVYDETRNEYDKYGRNTAINRIMSAESVELSGVTVSNGKVSSRIEYEYDVIGNKVLAKAPMCFVTGSNVKEHTTAYTYDKLNRLIKMQTTYDGEAVNTTYVYDKMGNKISVTDAKGGVTAYSYDEMNRVKSMTNAEGVTVSYGYDLAGNKISETRPSGVWEFEYDLLNRLTISKNPDNHVISKNVYDANDNIIKKIDGEGYANGEYGITYEYNMSNVLVASTTPEGGTTKYEYNTFGEITRVTDPMGNSKQYSYDKAGNLLTVTDEMNNTTTYTYDKAGNKTSFVDAKGNTTYYTYGAFSTLLTVTDAAGRSQSYKYNLTGQTTKIVDKIGNVITYNYNSFELPTDMMVTKLDGTTQSVSYTYDCLGNRVGMTDATGTYVYSYDIMQRLIFVSKDDTTQISYTYNDEGNIETTSYGGVVTQYTYDTSGRLSTVRNNNAGADYTYDLSGNITEIRQVGGASEVFAYNMDNAIMSVTNKNSSGEVIASYTYEYDANGRQISKVDQYGTTTYKYDNVGRLTKAVMPGKTSVYTYDAVGNRTSLTETYSDKKTFDNTESMQYNRREISYEYSVCDELTITAENMYDSSDVLIAGKNTYYTYDPNGNLYMTTSEVVTPEDDTETSVTDLDALDETSTEFSPYVDMTMNEFDGFNRLVKKTIIKNGNQNITEYTYNGDGLRTSKTVKKSDENYVAHTTNYIYDGEYVVMSTGDETATYVRGMNYIAKIGASDGINYYMYNAHGDVVQVTDSFGTVLNRYEYDPFGETILNIEETENSIMYAGEFYDESAGLYYLRARYYDPATGRFISADTYTGSVKDPASLNLYTYCQNDPVNFIDPSGHSSKPPAWMDWNGDGKVDTAEDMKNFDKNNDGIADWNQGKGNKSDYTSSSSGKTSQSVTTLPFFKSSGTNLPLFSLTGLFIPIISFGFDKTGSSNGQSIMYSGTTGYPKLVSDSEVDNYRNAGWYLGSDTVKIYNAYDLSPSETVGEKIFSKLNNRDGNGYWYTEHSEITLRDAVTGETFVTNAGAGSSSVQGGQAYMWNQTVPKEGQDDWYLIAGLKNLDIDALENVVTYDGVPKNYLQLLMEDMPYLQVMQGAKSSQYNQSTAALQDIFSALGMSIDNYGIYDSWSTRGAVNTIMDTNGKGDTYKDYSPTDADFYSRLREIIMAVGTMNSEEIATVRGGMRTLQKFYSNSFYQGQKEYERQQALIQAALREQEQRRQQEIENSKKIDIPTKTGTFISPLLPNSKKFESQLFIPGSYNNSSLDIDTLSSTISTEFKFGSVLLENNMTKLIENAERPNNIGMGTWRKYITQEVNMVKNLSNKLNVASDIIGITGNAIDAVYDNYNDIQQGKPDAVIYVNTAYDGVTDGVGYVLDGVVFSAASAVMSPIGAVMITTVFSNLYGNLANWGGDRIEELTYYILE